MTIKIKIIKRNLLHNNFIFIDGVAKSGKIVVSTIISSFKNTENQSLHSNINNYVKFNNLKLIDEDLTIDLILQGMQRFMIENQLSRFLNFRKNDLSSVNNSVKKKDYYNRLKINDDPNEIEKIIKNLKINKNSLPIVVDDFFPNCTGKLKFFYSFKKIITYRNPIGICYDNWIRQRAQKKIMGHSWQDVFHYKKNNKKIPWFVKPKDANKFISSSKLQKHLMFLSSEIKPYFNKNIFKIPNTKFVFLEDIWENPNGSVKSLSKFLKIEETKYTKLILKKLNLPRINVKENYEQQFYFLKSIMSLSEFKSVLNLEKLYKLYKNLYGF